MWYFNNIGGLEVNREVLSEFLYSLEEEKKLTKFLKIIFKYKFVFYKKIKNNKNTTCTIIAIIKLNVDVFFNVSSNFDIPFSLNF